jgi:lipopolysaccharide heptosyltransferase II
MGDLLMSTPAIRALKESLHCNITVLTSSMAAGIAKSIPEIDEVIVCDLPWVRTSSAAEFECYKIIDKIRQYQFDGAVVFSVYSQNPVPSIMLAYLAEIPLRLSYCRENPYALLTHWVPDREPYSFVQHQVRRDLNLVASMGATTDNEKLSLCFDQLLLPSLEKKLLAQGIAIDKPWMVLHPGVSEEKRMYPKEQWIRTAKMIRTATGFQLLFTGAASEAALTEMLADHSGSGCFSLAGKLSLQEFMLLVQQSPLIVSVNTGTIHIAAAAGTPVVALYALTNPQHSPWKTRGQVLLFDVPPGIRSKNEVIRFVSENLHPQNLPMVTPDEVVQAVKEVLLGNAAVIAEMIPLQTSKESVG